MPWVGPTVFRCLGPSETGFDPFSNDVSFANTLNGGGNKAPSGPLVRKGAAQIIVTILTMPVIIVKRMIKELSNRKITSTLLGPPGRLLQRLRKSLSTDSSSSFGVLAQEEHSNL